MREKARTSKIMPPGTMRTLRSLTNMKTMVWMKKRYPRTQRQGGGPMRQWMREIEFKGEETPEDKARTLRSSWRTSSITTSNKGGKCTSKRTTTKTKKWTRGGIWMLRRAGESSNTGSKRRRQSNTSSPNLESSLGLSRAPIHTLFTPRP